MDRAADSYLRLPRRRYLSATELHAVAIGSIAAAVLLLGWGLGVEFLKSLVPGFPTMKPATATGFMLLSMSCLTSLRGSRGGRLLSIALSLATIAWAIALPLVDPQRTNDETWAQVPSEATLLALAAGGLAMLLVVLTPQRALLISALAIAAGAPALFRIFAMALFRGAPPDLGSPLDTMALHTAALTLWFMLVCVLLHPNLTFARSILAASLRGRLLRRALPLMMLLPIAAAAVSLMLSLAVGLPQEALFAISATLSVMLGVGLIWWLSSMVEGWQKEANDQAARLSRANEALEQYASAAAHDLKAPARHVLLYGELLEEALARNDLAAARKHARSIRESAAEMPATIDGMLDYSRSAFTRVQLGEHSLSELVQAAASQNAADLEAAGAQVNVAHEAKLFCDSALITTVLQNLIANSIKNRRKDRKLTIRIDAVREGDFWRVSVEDNGVGFEPDFAAVAFNPLARGVHTAGEGGGIGLSTCRNIVQSHGGEIRVDPSCRNGARIEFTLPARLKTG